jgi:TIR domain
MAEEASKDFFISYNKADRGWAEWIAWQLEAEGYSTIIQAWDFRPGSNFILEMDRATTVAKRTITVLSPDYLDVLINRGKEVYLHSPKKISGLKARERIEGELLC